MPGVNSESFNTAAGGFAYWVFPAAATVRRVGVNILEPPGSTWQYRGFLTTFDALLSSAGQIFPERSLGAVWFPKAIIRFDTPIVMTQLLFRHSLRYKPGITLYLFYDTAD